MKSRFTVLWLVVLLGIFAVACDTETDTEVAEPSVEESEVVEEDYVPEELDADIPVQVTINDSGIDMPSSISADTSEFTVENTGENEHHFAIEGEGVSESLDEPLLPGEVMTMLIDLEPGEYRAVCDAAGFETAFTVTPAEREAPVDEMDDGGMEDTSADV